MVNELRKQIGQIFMVGLSGNALQQEELTLLHDFPVGGFILFKHNCSSPEQIRALCDSLWEVAPDPPPFIAIDQEGGTAHRLPEPFTHFPFAARVGERGDSSLAYRAGHATATEISLVGINLNFAPVLDVNSNPNSPVIGNRSFGADPRQVIAFSERWILGTRAAGIISCGKHFPGHGDTDKDSHLHLPCVDRKLEELRAVELPPFVHACQRHIESLMTAHVLYRALDDEFPATLSAKIVTGMLREALGYDGVVFSDALEMKAISDHYGDREASALCIQAGVDVLLYSHPMPTVTRVFEFLYNLAENDPMIRDRVEYSYRRILKLKRRYLKSFSGVPESEIVGRLSRLNHKRIVEQIYGSL
jgi:beta-N-acetylhexosaminidase